MTGEIRETPDGVERMVERYRERDSIAFMRDPKAPERHIVSVEVVATKIEGEWRAPRGHAAPATVDHVEWESWPLLFAGYMAENMPRFDDARPAWIDQLGTEMQEQLVEVICPYLSDTETHDGEGGIFESPDRASARGLLYAISETIDGFADCPECDSGVVDGEKCPVCNGNYRRRIEA